MSHGHDGGIKEHLRIIRERIAAAAVHAGRPADSVKLVAVSKRVPPERISEALSEGQNVFGENYLQEALAKIPLIAERSVQWHFIGNLQSNKARQAAQHLDVIESIDRLKIATALDEACGHFKKKMTVLIQVNVGRELQKTGVFPEDAVDFAACIGKLKNLVLTGLMTMPPYHENPEEVRPYFRKLRLLGEALKEKGIIPGSGPVELSMGMSHDFELAIEEGATLVRIGTAIFGER